MFNSQRLKDTALMYRDWGRIGNNSEDVSERFGHNVDGIEYDFKFLYGCVGYNMKACEMNAAFGLAQLEKLDAFKAIRKRNIRRYCENLSQAGTSYILPDRWDDFDWLAMPLLSSDRKPILRFLEANHVQTRVFFAGNITRHPAYRQYFQAFPGADRVMRDGFLVGAHHGLELEDIDRVCGLLIEYDRQKGTMMASRPGAQAETGDYATLDL
jgi:CDP-6-deoxy-D-xylo-4-hexulose-3-dehydrase